MPITYLALQRRHILELEQLKEEVNKRATECKEIFDKNGIKITEGLMKIVGIVPTFSIKGWQHFTLYTLSINPDLMDRLDKIGFKTVGIEHAPYMKRGDIPSDAFFAVNIKKEL
jgi:hypothetical protein